jgi:hypothetical protein
MERHHGEHMREDAREFMLRLIEAQLALQSWKDLYAD